MSLDDCVCEGNAKVSKLNHPVYYIGVSSEGHDPDFDFDNASVTSPTQQHVPHYPPVESRRPFLEWMIPYIEYLNPYTEIKEDWDKSAYIVSKQGQYNWYSIPESEKNKCELDPPLPEYASAERCFYWFHSIFGFEMHMNEDDGNWVFATKTNMDATIDFLYDTWDDDVFYEYFEGYFGEDCYNISWPFMDFGFAEHEKGAIVFDFCIVAWGFGSQVMPINSRYLGAVTGTRKQIFRIYTSYYEQMEKGSLSLACFNALNDLRTEEGLTKFSVNACLMEAAERHAIDQANNVASGDWGHDGTDGSTTQSRIEDTDFLLWMKTAQIRTWGENVHGQTGYSNDPVSIAIADWKGSPGHWSNIIDKDFTEIGIGVASNGDTTVFVTVFGGIPDKWPGFSALDTTEMEAYMNAEFVWAGEENKYQIPKLYLA